MKISDFGLSKIIADNSQLKTVCGTMLYVAPEILMTGGKGSYTEKVDLWSLGVVLYAWYDTKTNPRYINLMY